MWNLKYGTEQKQTHRPRDQTCGGRVGRRGMNWEFGVGRCKLLYLELINKKSLAQGTISNLLG